MKPIKLALCILASAVCLLAIGCASTSTTSTTDYYQDSELIAQERERTRRNTLFMRTSASGIDATMTRTNSVTLTNGARFTTSHRKNFGTTNLVTEAQADAIKATGEAIASSIAEALRKAASP